MTLFYLSAVDAVLTPYRFDTAQQTMTPLDAVSLPAKVQYAWRHPRLPLLYVACSAGGPRVVSSLNVVVCLAIGSDGSLRVTGPVQELPYRAVHICVSPDGHHLYAAHNFAGGGVSVLPIRADGHLQGALAQDPTLDFGIYPHQLRVSPSGRHLIVVDRGINAKDGQPERPGALRHFTLAGGQIGKDAVCAPDGGYGFGPRHIDFHPQGPWIYAADERFNTLMMFDYQDERLPPAPRHILSLLQDSKAPSPRQLGGAIHVHPKGHVVYVANRADETEQLGDEHVFLRGENAIAVFTLDPATGTPRLLQHAPLNAIHARTFSVDPSGRFLAAASIKPMHRRAADYLEHVPARICLFAIGEDGTLHDIGYHDVPTPAGALQYWGGFFAL